MEYAIVLTMVAIVAIGAWKGLGEKVDEAAQQASDELGAAVDGQTS